MLSIGSAGSILSIGSAGSILSIGSAGAIGSIGGVATIGRTAPAEPCVRAAARVLALSVLAAAALGR